MTKTVKRTTASGKKRTIIVHSASYIKRPSNVTKKAPSARLKKRRAANTVKGRYPNPRHQFCIKQIHNGKEMTVGYFTSDTIAKMTADMYNAQAKGGAQFVVRSV